MDGRPLSPEQKLGQDLAFQAIDSATKQVLSDEEKAELKALFELVDVDANGKVTRSELLKVDINALILLPLLVVPLSMSHSQVVTPSK